MPRTSKFPFHLLQAVHVPKDHPKLKGQGKLWRRPLKAIGVAYKAPADSLERKTRRVNFFTFRVMDPKFFGKDYKTFTDKRGHGVQVVSARLKPAYEKRVLTRNKRRPSRGDRSLLVYKAGAFRVAVLPSKRGGKTVMATGPEKATAKALIKQFGRARVRVL